MTTSISNITNLQFVSAGSNQVEFYTRDGVDYFSIYTTDPSAMIRTDIKLQDWAIQQTKGGFILKNGHRAHQINIDEKSGDYSMQLVSYLWGWLPYNSYKGKISPNGLSVIVQNLKKYT